MRYEFRCKNTFAAEVAMDLDKQQIITDLVAEAEKLPLDKGDYAIFDVSELGLKAVRTVVGSSSQWFGALSFFFTWTFSSKGPRARFSRYPSPRSRPRPCHPATTQYCASWCSCRTGV